jgi:hypothetical protein
MLKKKSSVLDGTDIAKQKDGLSRQYPLMGSSEEKAEWKKIAAEFNARWLAAGGESGLALREE